MTKTDIAGCSRLQPYFIGFCRVGVSQNQFFYVVSALQFLYSNSVAFDPFWCEIGSRFNHFGLKSGHVLTLTGTGTGVSNWVCVF